MTSMTSVRSVWRRNSLYSFLPLVRIQKHHQRSGRLLRRLMATVVSVRTLLLFLAALTWLH